MYEHFQSLRQDVRNSYFLTAAKCGFWKVVKMFFLAVYCFVVRAYISFDVEWFNFTEWRVRQALFYYAKDSSEIMSL